MKEYNYERESIALFRQIKEKKKSSDLLDNLKNACPKNLNIGIAIKTGDCFFDSVAQGLNELKPGNRFTAKSLREDCADYAKANKRSDFWVYKAVIKDAGIGGYSVELEGPYGPIQDPKTKINMIDEEKTFNKYLEYITNTHTETEAPIWGRPEIEGRMICDKYEVELCIYSIEEYSQKVTVTKITANNDDPKVFIEDENLDQLKIDNSKKTVGVVNYMRHFVPLLSRISEDITKSQPVSNEEILGTDKRVPTSDQSEKEVQQEIINISTSAPVYADEASLSSHQPEQKTRQERINTSTSGINPPVLQDHTDRGIPTSDQSEKEVQQEIINTSTSATVYTNKGIPASHRQEQKTQQKGVQKKLINSYRKEAIYGTVAVIAAIVFTPSAIAAAFTQSIPLAFLAGIALVVACVCVYQLTQSHKNINELKSELEENSTLTFLEETGLKMHDLINKAISKV